MKSIELSSGKLTLPFTYGLVLMLFLSMKTQMTLVQNHEDVLEQKRLHCKRPQPFLQRLRLTAVIVDLKVVEAFKSALHLLAG